MLRRVRVRTPRIVRDMEHCDPLGTGLGFAIG